MHEKDEKCIKQVWPQRSSRCVYAGSEQCCYRTLDVINKNMAVAFVAS